MRKCWICGKEATKHFELFRLSEQAMRYKDVGMDVNFMTDRQLYEQVKQREYCAECFDKVIEEHETDRAEYLKLKKKLMFERALRMFERQMADIYEYREAIDVVEEHYKNNLNKYDSAHEMLAAIILIDNELETKTQYKVGKYTVDFCLPGLKIVLEIDGGLHRHSLYKDNNRDIEIRSILGKDWEVVRIKTEYLEQNAGMLVEAIKAIKKEKQKIRRQNYGMLPEWYSKREKAKKPKKQAYGDELLLD